MQGFPSVFFWVASACGRWFARPPAVLRCVVASTAALFLTTACATEGGGSVYPYGLNTVASGVLPKPGGYLYNYNSYYTADTTTNNSGESAVPHFHASVRAHTIRFLNVFESFKVMGGDLALLIAQPYLDGRVEVASARGEGGGFGDLTTGLMVGWHGQGWHRMAGVDFTLPSGSYSRTQLFNPGRNQYAATPYYGVTLLLGERVDANLRVNLTLNGKNDDTRYKSGIESGFDYSLNLRVIPQFFVGLNGYLQHQLTDDRLDGVSVGGNGKRIHVFSYGPQAIFRGDGWGISAKLQHETQARNKSEGDKYWLQLFFAL